MPPPVPFAQERWLSTRDNLVLLEDTRSYRAASYLFVDPIHILQIRRVAELPTLLATMQDYLRQGYYLAGYFAYECGYSIEKLNMQNYVSEHRPLAWFGVYRQPYHFEATSWQSTAQDYQVRDLQFNLDEATYREKIERVRDHIRAGDVYQVNFTGRYHFKLAGSSLALYSALRRAQQTHYSAYIRTGGREILCCSPELFFRIDGQQITTRPMKGTAPRGRTLEEDEEQRTWLQQDRKNRAENVMIVDLLRNDLGRVCETRSVSVPQLFHVEQYATLFQMTSTITGTLDTPNDFARTFASLFPCGSVTGAPKIKAMEIINQLEDTPRGVYTGAVGYFAPVAETGAYRAIFNVAIRTVVIEDGHGEMGIGGGIVYDSEAASEYTECMVKARFLTTRPHEWSILETLLWDGEYQRIEKHLARMERSAHYFDYPFERDVLLGRLEKAREQMLSGGHYRVRLLLDRTGQPTCQVIPLQAGGEVPGGRNSIGRVPAFQAGDPQVDSLPQVILSKERTDSQDPFYFHKTTHRPLYERASRFAREHGYADVIFLNEKGEVTEGAISNIFIERDGKLLTPPITCGLLGGVYRACVLEEHPDGEEAILTLDDLRTAERIFLCNSVRGLYEVKLCPPEEACW